MSNFTPIRLGMRKDEASGRWRLEVAIPARKDQWPDPEDVVAWAGDLDYSDEAVALSSLAEALALIE